MAKADVPAAKLDTDSAPVSNDRRLGVVLAAVVAVIVAAAACVRIWAAQDEFWLDEIWSLVVFARTVESPWDIFTLHWDNNHYLVTLWMYLFRAQANWFIFRIPSVAAGTGTVILAALIARRWGAFATFAAAMLTGTSYLMIQYSSEARGYALAGFFALAAFLALDRYLATRSVWANIVFVVATMLGLLSHLTFIIFYLGALAWSMVSCRNSAPNWRSASGLLLRCHAVPVCFLVALYLIDVRAMRVAGGDPYVTINVVAHTLALSLGSFAERPIYVLLAGLLGAAAAVAAIVGLRRERSDLWVFFAVTVGLSPALLLLVTRPPFLYERYFYISYTFLLLLFSYLLGRAAQRRWTSKSVAAIALAVVVLGNVKLTHDFLQRGRGHFLDALEYMAAHTDGPDIFVKGTHETRDTAYLHFYVPYVPSGQRFLYHNVLTDKRLLYQNPAFDVLAGAVPLDDVSDEDQWAIVQDQSRPFQPPELVDVKGTSRPYRFERAYPFAGMSGFNFALYRCDSDQDAAVPKR